MAFKVACHTVDNVGHGLTRAGVIGVVVDNGRVEDSAISGKGKHTFIPVDMAVS